MQINRNIVPITDKRNHNIEPLLAGEKWENIDSLGYNFPKTDRVFAEDIEEARQITKPLPESKQKYVTDALSEIETFTQVNFVEVEDGEVSNFIFSAKDSKNGLLVVPLHSEVANYSGEILIGNDMLVAGPYQLSNHRMIRMAIGDMLGLTAPDDATFLYPGNNIHHMGDSVMLNEYPPELVASYPEGTQMNNIINPQTFMPHDIAALQHLYGADYSHNPGVTRYEWSIDNINEDGVGEIIYKINGVKQEIPYSTSFYHTIWDGGGFDAYNFSSLRHDIRIDLRPGGETIFGGEANHAIVRNSLINGPADNRPAIEAAIAGIGNDKIYGNNFSNRLFGNDGNDLIHGYGGDDFIDGEGGSDIISGDKGNDQLNGGAGRDYFLATSFMDHDTILDFETVELGDVIQVSDEFDFTTTAEIFEIARQVDDNIVIRFDENNSMTLHNTQLEELNENNFSIVKLALDL